MYCCPNCFSDVFLQKHINAVSNKPGKCSFCKTENAALIKPEKLFDRFEPLLALYEEAENGTAIHELLQNDWKVFEIADKRIQRKLIKEISGNKNMTKMKFVPIHLRERENNVKKWEEFREELMYENRFFPNKAFSVEKLKSFTPFIGSSLKKGSQMLYRARICKGGEAYDIAKMGKPPRGQVSNGRANPIGISYLYLASEEATAISEVRGSKGEFVTVAEFRIKSDLTMIDLRDPLGKISPFELNRENELELIYKNIPFLISFGTELSKPIIPRWADLEYLPSQYLCELFKSMGFHGIIHKSSIADGDNCVIFADEEVEAVNTIQYEITNIRTEFRRL